MPCPAITCCRYYQDDPKKYRLVGNMVVRASQSTPTNFLSSAVTISAVATARPGRHQSTRKRASRSANFRCYYGGRLGGISGTACGQARHRQFAAIVGGSLGGMQAMQWSLI